MYHERERDKECMYDIGGIAKGKRPPGRQRHREVDSVELILEK
jgi:hypothetical protein